MRNKKDKVFLLLIAIALCQTVAAQTFGGNPSSMKWRYINTDSIQVIYPEGLDSTAFDVAGLIQFQQRNIAKSIGDKFRKIPVVLQNQTANSNGYVGLGPFRSEYYLMPPMNALALGAQNWAKNLAIHEYRHAEQYNNFDRGISHLARIIFGDNGQALANAAAIPDWFFEGDAVYNETRLSRQGRGRLPDFMNVFDILEKDGKQYNYQKLRNGSYKDFVPNHYNLGYLLVAYGYHQYGDDFWKNVTQRAAGFKGIVYPFQAAIKRYSGIPFQQFRKDAFRFYQQQWEKTADKPLHFISRTEPGNVTDYQYPYPAADGSIIVLKTDRKHIPEFIRIYNGKEKTIGTAPVSRDNYFGYNNGKIIYTVLKPDARWGYKENSDLRILDIASGKEKTVTRNKRYFTPDMAHNGRQVAAISILPGQQSAVDVLDTDGNILSHFVAPANHLYAYPKFSQNDAALILFERNDAGEMAVQKINLLNRNKETILPFGNRLLGFPTVQGDTLFFTCANNNMDEGWALQLSTGKCYRVAQNIRGVYQMFANKDSLLASVFTADGYRLARMKLNFSAIGQVEKDTLTTLYTRFPAPDYSRVLADLPKQDFETKKYHKFTHPFHFHSLQPYVDDPDYSLTLYGENILNTLQTNLSYIYNRVEESQQIGGGTVYGGWFVQPFANITYTFNRTVRVRDSDKLYHFDEPAVNFGLQLPLNFSSGKYYRYVNFSAAYNQSKLIWKQAPPNALDRNTHYMQTALRITAQSQQAMQQVYPPFAQTLYLQYREALDKNNAWQWLASGSIYLPGLLATHSLKLSGAYQRRDTLGNYSYPGNFPFSRGYAYHDFPEMWKLGIDYAFPVFYPDFGAANIFYVNRVRGNVFYDNSFGNNYTTKTQSFASAGAAVFIDFTIWNQQPYAIGIRFSRLLQENEAGNRNRWELILPIHLF